MNMEGNNTIISTETEVNKAKKTQKKKRSGKNSKETTESPQTTVKTFFREECKKDTSMPTPQVQKSKVHPVQASHNQNKEINKTQIQKTAKRTQVHMKKQSQMMMEKKEKQ